MTLLINLAKCSAQVRAALAATASRQSPSASKYANAFTATAANHKRRHHLYLQSAPNGRADAVCLKQPTAGMCSLVSHAWYFDRLNQSCKLFSYSTCTKRHNYFLSEMKCQSVCLPQRTPKPFCSEQPISTFCTGSANRWYFDERKNTCLVYLNKRCGKGRNSFKTFAQCMGRCSYATS
ncbi:amblin-like isoform X2 [Dermacentor variabilis]|uniref:amblin-like isoform X2 n=1 Tax=Dermacentor variabilis TaxID=34621 RepID=UPI003F5B5ECB